MQWDFKFDYLDSFDNLKSNLVSPYLTLFLRHGSVARLEHYFFLISHGFIATPLKSVVNYSNITKCKNVAYFI